MVKERMTNTILTLHDPEAAARYYAEGLWCRDTLYTLLTEHAARRPEAFALRDGAQRLSRAALLKLVDAVAADLDAAGLKRGERVAVWLPSCVEAVAVLLACSRNGYVCNPSLHRNYTVAEIVELLARTRATALFAQRGYGADANTADIFTAVAELPNLRRVYARGDAGPATKAEPFPDPDSARPLPAIETNPDKVTYLAFTSGTTGTPKATMHFHRDLIACCDTYAAHVLRPRGDDLFCGSPPLAFTFGLGGLLLFPLYAGAATLLLEKAGPHELLEAIATHGVTTIFTAPVAYRTMCARLPECDVSSLRTCVSAGETLPKTVWEEWHAKTGLTILDGIGSTEMIHIFVGSPRDEAVAGSTGRAVPGYVAEIHDDDGNPVPDGTVGRLAVKGPTGCKYLQDERQTLYVQRGWNYPGDAYRRDEGGYFWYVARMDDMIVSSGYNISGPEVEQALIAHADVKEVAVVGKRDPVKETNVVKAFVVLAGGCAATPEKAAELCEFAKTQIAPFKAPREIEFVSALPRTETGKLQRYKLRERAETH
jgi:2-aminobenzoate-CoA ligase